LFQFVTPIPRGTPTIPVNGDGECLFYATNAAHFAQQNIFLLDHRSLRLVACTVARNFLLHPDNWIEGPEGSIPSMRSTESALLLGEIPLKAPFFHALASIRNGTIIIIGENRNEAPQQFEPLTEMLRILYAPNQAPPRTPPIHLLHRTTAAPLHFDATAARATPPEPQPALTPRAQISPIAPEASPTPPTQLETPERQPDDPNDNSEH